MNQAALILIKPDGLKKSMWLFGLIPLATLSTETTNFRMRSFVRSHLANSGFADRARANSRTAASLAASGTAGNGSNS